MRPPAALYSQSVTLGTCLGPLIACGGRCGASVFAPEHQHRLAHVGLEEEGQPRLGEVGELDGLVVDEAAVAVLDPELALVAGDAQLDDAEAVALQQPLVAGQRHGVHEPVGPGLLGHVLGAVGEQQGAAAQAVARVGRSAGEVGEVGQDLAYRPSHPRPPRPHANGRWASASSMSEARLKTRLSSPLLISARDTTWSSRSMVSGVASASGSSATRLMP